MKPIQESEVHFDIASKNVRQMPVQFAHDHLEDVQTMGFRQSPQVMREMAQMYGIGMDSAQGLVTAASIPNLIQFQQFWMPGQVYVMTAAREIDNLIGISTMGEWSDEQVVQQTLELTGNPSEYGDYTNVPLADWNSTYVPRTIVRLELGMRVGILEEERSAKQRIASGQTKRESCGLQLEISRNLIGFYGYNNGDNNTYGFLNDPGLPAWVSVANSGSGSSTLWANKTFAQIQADLLTMFVQIRTQSKGIIDAKRMATILALPTNAIDFLSVTTDFGYSVRKWLEDNYPMVSTQDAIQLDTANGNSIGDGGMVLYPERIQDLSTDDGKVWVQPVPQKFRVLGVQKLTKAYQEDYSNATAGAMCKRPWAVVRYFGIS